MYLHKDNGDLFRDIILLVSEKLNISADIIEKDYYVTMVLKKLSDTDFPVVFKGGTSLSKAFGIINRFSEDIDITFSEHLGEARRKKLKYNILKPLGDELGLNIADFESIQNYRNLNQYVYNYSSVIDDSFLRPVEASIKLETSLGTYASPAEQHIISNYIYDVLGEEEKEIIERYELHPFTMNVQTMERTLADKIFAVCDYYIKNKPERHSRHLYDIYKLIDHVNISEQFLDLIKQVRDYRKKLGEDIAPAAADKSDIIQLAEKLCAEDFYKNDYTDTTMKLLSGGPDYEIVRDSYLNLVKEIF